MANAICHDRYCESTQNREDGPKTTLGDKVLIISGYFLFSIALVALLVYEASQGIYVDTAFLS